jgi:putative redox protein
MDVVDRIITLEGALTEEQRAKLLEIAERCPVHQTLQGKIQVNTSFG